MIDFTSEFVSNSIVVVKVHGVLDRMSRNYFFDCIGDQFSSDVRHVVIDCTGLGTVTSSAVMAMLAARMRTRKRGQKIYFTHLSSSVANVLEVTKLGMLMVIHRTTRGLLDYIYKSESPRLEPRISSLTSQ